ncbi:MAG: hypothetical protein WD751_04645 [Anaerolineales bacterium]
MNLHNRYFLTAILFLALLSGCVGNNTAAGNVAANTPLPTSTITSRPTQTTPASTAGSATPTPAAQPAASEVSSATPAATADWKSWPMLPTVSAELKAVYQLGLENGNDPHAFSILGDCQSQPDVFLGLYDSDPAAVADLPDHLQETVRFFSGSFDRYSPTVKDATTTGALLWGEWNDNKEGLCEPGETPLDCELRVHRPSIVIIHIGTHWETRNYKYLTIIVEKIIEHGAVPVLATKADDRELDERVNEDVAALAEELGLPVWNFWAAVQGLTIGGLDPDSTWELTGEALEIHRLSALEALDAVWRAVTD